MAAVGSRLQTEPVSSEMVGFPRAFERNWDLDSNGRMAVPPPVAWIRGDLIRAGLPALTMVHYPMWDMTQPNTWRPQNA